MVPCYHMINILIHDYQEPMKKEIIRYSALRLRYFYSNVNSLWPSDSIRQQRSGSTLVQEMVCCLTAPSHCGNQCWSNISECQWHSLRVPKPLSCMSLKMLLKSPRNQWVNLSILIWVDAAYHLKSTLIALNCFHQNASASSIISSYWDGTGTWNSSRGRSWSIHSILHSQYHT